MAGASEGANLTPGLVSIVIAAYNAEPYIAGTCRSALAQTYRSIEVIVVDDGSTDRTAEIVREMSTSDARLRLIQQPNLGVAAARNCGIEAASGEFVAPLDADDVWNHQKVARQVERFKECGPGAGLVYCWWAWLDADKLMLDRSPRWEVEGRVHDKLVEVNFTGGGSVPLYRRTSIQQVGGYSVSMRDQGGQGCEDWDLAIRVAEEFDVAVVSAVLVGYRRLPDSMSADCEAMWRSKTQVMERLSGRRSSVPAKVIRRSNTQFALYLAGVAFWSRRYVEACRWGLRARSLSLLLNIMPYVVRLIVRRMLGSVRQAPARFIEAGPFDDSRLPDPLIPYDDICARRWEREEPGTRVGP
jgi:glycosyltransferase involved in cell wall biosynthesis